MQLWGYIDIQSRQLEQLSPPLSFHDDGSEEAGQSRPTFEFCSSTLSWQKLTILPQGPDPVSQLVVASYNVLAEFEWPPDTGRYGLLISTILSEHAAADVLVLQEVTDDFLPYLLQHPHVCDRYRFSSQGPPGHLGHGPLPSLLNIVVLSKFAFAWAYVPFARKHKGAVVLTLAASCRGSPTKPIVVAACHLTQGLTDGAVVAKKNEFQKLINYLLNQFCNHPWIIAGDFNLATSEFTVDLARKKGQLSSHGYQRLCEIDEMFTNYDLQDAWLLTRLRSGVSQDASSSSLYAGDLFEGEQGATFNPFTNQLAAKAVGSGLNNRPQRYDRILFNNSLSLSACGFNTFGRPISREGAEQPMASDHWGVRCLFRDLDKSEDIAVNRASSMLAAEFRTAPSSLGDLEGLKDILIRLGCWPSKKDEGDRVKALELLQRVLCEPAKDQTIHGPRAGLDIILIPVGSYGLGVWTPDSDVDCLCVGKMSSKTFFTIALSKIRKAKNHSIGIIRLVRAKTGIMLELSVFGIKFDLQYCAASLIVERRVFSRRA
jgi:hypothetical protein